MFLQAVLVSFTQILCFLAFIKYKNVLSFQEFINWFVEEHFERRVVFVEFSTHFYGCDLLLWHTLIRVWVRQEHMQGIWQTKHRCNGTFLPSTDVFSFVGIRFTRSYQHKHDNSLRFAYFYFHVDKCLPEWMYVCSVYALYACGARRGC